MGEIRTHVTLSNAIDEALVRRGQLAADKVRRVELDAVVDTGAIRTVLPQHVVERLGLAVAGHIVVRCADGRSDPVGVAEPVVVECQARRTTEDALILGDEVLLGQTTLEKLDLLANCTFQRLMPHPDRPNQPMQVVRRFA
jgi:clan AA aspartic protease